MTPQSYILLQPLSDYGEGKTKSTLFSNRNTQKKVGTLDINYDDIKVTYLGCELAKNLSGEAMALKIINNVNCRLMFLYRKTDNLKRLACNAKM